MRTLTVRQKALRYYRPDRNGPRTQNPHERRDHGLKRVGHCCGRHRSRQDVNPVAHPPVCKLLDFGKYKYETVKARV
jgi:translation initiation factor IF-3-like protein